MSSKKKIQKKFKKFKKIIKLTKKLLFRLTLLFNKGSFK